MLKAGFYRAWCLHNIYWLILLTAITTSACKPADDSSSASFSGSSISSVSATELYSAVGMSQQPASKAKTEEAIAKIAAMPLSDYVNSLADDLTDAPVTINGRQVRGLKSALLAHKAEIRAFSTKYPTVGALWRESNLSVNTLTAKSIGDSLDQLTTTYNEQRNAGLNLSVVSTGPGTCVNTGSRTASNIGLSTQIAGGIGLLACAAGAFFTAGLDLVPCAAVASIVLGTGAAVEFPANRVTDWTESHCKNQPAVTPVPSRSAPGTAQPQQQGGS